MAFASPRLCQCCASRRRNQATDCPEKEKSVSRRRSARSTNPFRSGDHFQNHFGGPLTGAGFGNALAQRGQFGFHRRVSRRILQPMQDACRQSLRQAGGRPSIRETTACPPADSPGWRNWHLMIRFANTILPPAAPDKRRRPAYRDRASPDSPIPTWRWRSGPGGLSPPCGRRGPQWAASRRAAVPQRCGRVPAVDRRRGNAHPAGEREGCAPPR